MTETHETPATPEAVLEVEGLKVTFRSREGKLARAVDGVDLSVARGEIIALAGESGCGKTTLARTILGLEKPSAGTVRYAGRPLDRSTKSLKAYRRKVQLVLQDPSGSLNPRHTVYDSVAEGLRVHKVRRRRAGARVAVPSPAPGCGRRSATSCATRTSSRAGSASASSSPERSLSSPR